MGGRYWKETSGSNYLCLPEKPLWGSYDDTKNTWVSHVVGVEIDLESKIGPYPWSVNQKNPPCAVCNVERGTSVVMIPGRNQCYEGWHQEYTGYLMSISAHGAHPHSTEYICMDLQPEGVPGQDGNQNPSVIHPVESICKGLPCPPYVDGRELTCIVCSK